MEIEAYTSIAEQYGFTNDQVIREAIDLLDWALTERRDGRRICSVAAKIIVDDCLITELVEGDDNGYMFESPLLTTAAESKK